MTKEENVPTFIFFLSYMIGQSPGKQQAGYTKNTCWKTQSISLMEHPKNSKLFSGI